VASSEELSSLVSKLEQFAETLSQRERRLLRATFYCASDPLDRMLMKTRLSEEEKDALTRLANGNG